jgi:hypothetical protein
MIANGGTVSLKGCMSEIGGTINFHEPFKQIIG